MIQGYGDYAANERTFLAWLRTGIAVVAFGFVIEKLNLFAITLANVTPLDAAGRAQLERFSGSLGRGAGHAFILLGITFVVVATFRFVRTARLLNDKEIHSPSIVVDLALSVPLALLLAALSAYLVLG
jgi:putative membrane protein